MIKPKFEKVNDHTIKIIEEVANDVDLADLLKRRDTMEKRTVELEVSLKNAKQIVKDINMILKEAEKLGITAKKDEKVVPVPKTEEK